MQLGRSFSYRRHLRPEVRPLRLRRHLVQAHGILQVRWSRDGRRRTRRFRAGQHRLRWRLVIFAPANTDCVGIFDPTTNAFSCVHILSTPSLAFRGATTTSDGRVVFAPYDANCVGIFDPAISALSCAPLPSTISGTATGCAPLSLTAPQRPATGASSSRLYKLTASAPSHCASNRLRLRPAHPRCHRRHLLCPRWRRSCSR